MNCLINHIGLKGCGQGDAPSGYYINDLLSDALQQTAKLTTAEKATFTEIWNDVQKRAVRRFGVDVSNFLSKKYRLKRVTDSINLGNFVDLINNQTPAASTGEYRGLVIDLNPSGGCGNSAMQVIHVQYLQVYLKQAATVRIAIVEGNTQVAATYTIHGVKGWNKIAEELNFSATQLAIVYNGGPAGHDPGIDSPALELPENACNCGAALGCDQLHGGCCEASIKGIIASEANGIEYGTNTFGISGIFSVNCSYEGFVCTNKNLFTYPLWQLLGYFLMDERIYSSRLNQFTLVNVEGAKERRDKFLEEYNRAMLDVLDGIDLCETADCCLECNELLTVRETVM